MSHLPPLPQPLLSPLPTIGGGVHWVEADMAASISGGIALKKHGLKIHRLSWEGSLLSRGKSWLGSRCSRLRARGTVVSINKFLLLGLRRPNDFLKVKMIRLRDQEQPHVVSWSKIKIRPYFDQDLELKCRYDAPSQRTSQEREMLRLKETRIGQSLEETQLVIAVQLNILSTKTRHLSDNQVVLHLIHNFKVIIMNNKN